ncbi:MAG: hypothetical protein ACKOWR_01265 [Micrococcales bacterium]
MATVAAMDFVFMPSAAKHGIRREDALYAMMFATYTRRLSPERTGSYIRLFIGYQHSQSSRELEVLVRAYESSRWPEVFHVMWLSSKYDQYRKDYPNELVD